MQGFPYGSVTSTSNPWQPSASEKPGYYFSNVGNLTLGVWNFFVPLHLPFLTTLNFLDLSKLNNDLIHYNPTCPSVPIKHLSDIPKYEGNFCDDIGDHVTTFHLWCSSNSLNGDSIRLRLFQHA